MKFIIYIFLVCIVVSPVYSQLTQLESIFPLYKVTVPTKKPQALPQILACKDQMYSFVNLTGTLEYYQGPLWKKLPKNQFIVHSYQSNLDKRILSKPFGLFRGEVVNSIVDSNGLLLLTTTAQLHHSTLPKKKKFEKALNSDSIYLTCIDPSTSVRWSRAFGITNSSYIQYHSVEHKNGFHKVFFQVKDTLYLYSLLPSGLTESVKRYAIPQHHKVSFSHISSNEELIVVTTRIWPQYEISLEEQHFVLSYSIIQTLKWKEYVSGTRFEVFIKSFLVDTKGSVYLLGNFLNEITSAFTTVKSKGQQDIFVIKISKQGSTLGVFGIGGKEGDNFGAATLTKTNDLILSGQMYSTGTVLNEVLDFNQKPFTFVSKISNDNRLIFAKVFGGYSVVHNKITEDHHKRILLVGMFKDTLTTRNGDVLISKGGNDFYLATYDEYGNFEAVQPFGSEADESYLLNVLLIPNNSVSVLAYTTGILNAKKEREYSQVLWRFKYQR